MVTDHKLDPRAAVSRRVLPIPVTTATSQTDRAFFIYKPGYSFEVRALRASAYGVVATVAIDAVAIPETGVITAGAITLNSDPTKLDQALHRLFIAGLVVEVAATTALEFSAAHVVTQGKFGAIQLRRSTAGAFTTAVPAETATTPMEFDTALDAENAVKALAPAAGTMMVGYLIIEALSDNDWVANTDDLEESSDLESLEIVAIAAQGRVLHEALVPAAGKEVVGIRSSRERIRGSAHDYLVLLFTTGVSGALTNGIATIEISARPGAGQSSYE